MGRKRGAIQALLLVETMAVNLVELKDYCWVVRMVEKLAERMVVYWV